MSISCFDCFRKAKAKATFFTLGWLAERYPRLVRDIVANGHELASHGYGHLRASEQSEEGSQDVQRAKSLLEDTAGVPVRGYRAPSFSIGRGNLWAFRQSWPQPAIEYSSSVYPVRHDHYGMPDAPRFPFRVRDRLLEIPVTTTRMFGRNLPAGGGGYFRLAPYPRVALGHRPRESGRSSSGDLLLPPVGDGPGTAARTRHQCKDPFPPLPESRSNRVSTEAAPARLPLGPSRPCVRSRRRVRPDNAPIAASAPLTVRPYREADRAAWSSFVERARRRRFSIGSNGGT